MTPSLQVSVTPSARQPTRLAEAGYAVGAEGRSLEQAAIFVHAIGFTAFDADAGVGVGEAATGRRRRSVAL